MLASLMLLVGSLVQTGAEDPKRLTERLALGIIILALVCANLWRIAAYNSARARGLPTKIPAKFFMATGIISAALAALLVASMFPRFG